MGKIKKVMLEEVAEHVGLTLIGASNHPVSDRAMSRLREWQEAGHAGEMRYMTRTPPPLADLLPSARSVVSFAAFYDRSPRPPLQKGHGKVARYAWGRDYHRVLKRRAESFVLEMARRAGIAIEARVFVDAAPILERAYAEQSGIGFFGRNTLIIRPGQGSFSFLGEVVWNLEIETPDDAPRKGGCGTCRRCINECPTGAIVADGVVDARRCISYLSIEKRTALSAPEREALGEWIFGCDVCQDVCPFNHASLRRGLLPTIEEFSAAAGVGPSLELRSILALRRDDQFVARFGGTAIMRAKRAGLLRNAAIVAANTDCEEATADLELALREDPAPIVRQHSLWALSTLKKRCDSLTNGAYTQLLNLALRDTDAEVRGEAESLMG